MGLGLLDLVIEDMVADRARMYGRSAAFHRQHAAPGDAMDAIFVVTATKVALDRKAIPEPSYRADATRCIRHPIT
jgi:alpha-D-ribose 1-methylphosphonate 5-triphosphate synthase subunit PhnI